MKYTSLQISLFALLSISLFILAGCVGENPDPYFEEEYNSNWNINDAESALLDATDREGIEEHTEKAIPTITPIMTTDKTLFTITGEQNGYQCTTTCTQIAQ